MPGEIVKVSGPLVVAKNMPTVKMYEVVYVSDKKLIGEVVGIVEEKVFIQVYEDTSGVGVGEPVYETGKPLTVELGPGLIGGIYDGIQRPLEIIMSNYGYFITRGVKLNALDRTKKWEFTPTLKNKSVQAGDILGYVQETPILRHYILVPPDVDGEIVELSEGEYKIEDTIGRVKLKDGKIRDLKMYHEWPVRIPRKVKEKMQPTVPLFTGQRVIDTFFPVAKGGTACVPGPFGSGKTVIQHQLSKWSDAEVIIFVGCGERGNEMTDVLIEFPKLKDPKSGRPLMERTVLVANTSNMPVAAREASIYTGITIGEYFRDMGYSVALMADSTSRWAEALREISGRLEEMPGEEGYPAYLPKKLAEFYERAGRVSTLGSDERIGSLTVIGAVSPPGGDLSDPVVQGTLKVVKVFWSLEEWLAHARHFPAISWLTSYSLYHADLEDYYEKNISENWTELRVEAMKLLQKEAELKEIVRLVGYDALSDHDKLILEAARSVREDFLYQSAFDAVDTYCSGRKQHLLLDLVISFYKFAKEALDSGKELEKIIQLPVKEDIARARFISEDKLDRFKEIKSKLKQQIENV